MATSSRNQGAVDVSWYTVAGSNGRFYCSNPCVEPKVDTAEGGTRAYVQKGRKELWSCDDDPSGLSSLCYRPFQFEYVLAGPEFYKVLIAGWLTLLFTVRT